MEIRSTIQIALRAMRANKVRTGLTVLGIVIGIASVIIVYSAGEGINNLIIGQIQSFGGSDMIETEIKLPSTKKDSSSEEQGAIALAQGVQVTTLTLEDMADINKIPNIKDSYAAIIGQEQVSYGNEMKKSMIMGVTASIINIDPAEIDYGRFFEDAEDRSLSTVAVLGPKIKEELFGSSDPIGKYIKIHKTKFLVVGVLKERGAVFTFDFDKMIYLPIRTLQKKVMGINHILMMMHKVYDERKIDETAEDIRLLLRQNHNIIAPPKIAPAVGLAAIGEGPTNTSKDDFRVVTMKDTIDIMKTVTGAITLLLLAIVIISLIVGGVGILNIMYVLVTERTAEIGLRKAVGARYSDIMLQFLLEAIIVTTIGGIIGIILGIGISLLITLGARSYGLDWKFLIPLKSIFVAFGFSTFFGLAFGVYPARKAARLDPIEALRNE